MKPSGEAVKHKDAFVYYTPFQVFGETWTLFATEQGLCRIHFPHEGLESAAAWLRRHLPRAVLTEDREVFLRNGAWAVLEAYFAGKAARFEDIALDLRGTPFQQEVWRELGRIPAGTTRSYREIAEAVGRPQAVRAVGAANGANPLPVIFPCHRVIGADGTLTGYRGGLRIKQALLALEGVSGLAAAGHARFDF
ncbi:methylated-DNA/protein-cysteine methyltransferase [Paenibacillus mucilaginosus 3016]|uniref:Methylated-DNA--protein-cysteine methyltransferase n=1 Tax=Paenibacillus mucilaginosus 3016 TaxID=1116391 RepID=H6NG01_9BACL|nr:methylated-DNA--[protein]-cysteine S-methyltransferase [Paenibacillus mucilaginosus]AFC31420.1 methylated-DNA/protein-cysteine methyltransferase [Paenibacillus mucilaginosus 3016]WFA19969.1 methylated-DNA--[protein]-cysteine S-methyltransferase [Paenibacillus mucilaginosus]